KSFSFFSFIFFSVKKRYFFSSLAFLLSGKSLFPLAGLSSHSEQVALLFQFFQINFIGASAHSPNRTIYYRSLIESGVRSIGTEGCDSWVRDYSTHRRHLRE